MGTTIPTGDRLLLNKHVKLLKMCLDALPSDYSVFQTSKPTLLYFLLSSCDLLGQLDAILSEEERQKIVDWIYQLQLGGNSERRGFRGNFLQSSHPTSPFCPYECSHLAQTYTTLCCLLILGDDLARVDRQAVLDGVKACQCEDGSFSATAGMQSENDMRFVFCACAICYILDNFSQIDLHSLTSFIRRSIGYDGGIGQGPGLESHGGSTFCAIASLALIGRLWDGSVLNDQQIERLKAWALMRQQEGFHGRVNKPDDSCYAFWIGATLTILNAQSLVNWPRLRAFLFRMQDRVIGGFCKYDESSHSDLLHTYFSLAALGMFGEPFVRPIFPALNVSSRAHEHLQRLKRGNCNKIIDD